MGSSVNVGFGEFLAQVEHTAAAFALYSTSFLCIGIALHNVTKSKRKHNTDLRVIYGCANRRPYATFASLLRNKSMHRMQPQIYSPNRRRTRLNTLSFSGS
jgi:hypothetical protein